MEHGVLGFSGSVIRWVVLTFPCYQCNELHIRGATKDQERFVVNWMMYIETIHMYLYSESTELIIEYKIRTNYESQLCHDFMCQHVLCCIVMRHTLDL